MKTVTDLEFIASETIYRMLLLLPTWKMRESALLTATARVKNMKRWSKENGRKEEN